MTRISFWGFSDRRKREKWEKLTKSDLYKQLLIISYSIAGNLARISLQTLTTYEGSYIDQKSTVLWVNFTACFVIALVNNIDNVWNNVCNFTHYNSQRELATYIGITVGFCGSLSTYSSMILEIFDKTIDVNSLLANYNSGYKVMEFFSTLLINMAIPIFAYTLGKHLGLLVNHFVAVKPAEKSKWSRSIVYINCLEVVVIIIGALALIANLVLTIVLNVNHWYRNDYSFNLLMGTLGAILRYQLSKLNSKRWFPIGTFMANVIGVVILAICDLLVYGKASRHPSNDVSNKLISNKLKLMIINGFGIGFAGSLTTISTFINELYNMNPLKHKYYYFWITFVITFGLVIIIDGSYAWTRGFVPN